MIIKTISIQTSPIPLNNIKNFEMIRAKILDLSEKEPDIIVFSELILSGYPNFKISSSKYRKLYVESAADIRGALVENLSWCATEVGSVIIFGFVESDPKISDVIYDSACIIDKDGSIIGSHRKISPYGL
jgi:predicted amidohydrolase